MTMSVDNMTATEKRAAISLSLIMGLRMIGLFMVLPVFALYAQQLQYATPTLVGLGLGIYGLSQALLQIPFGALSDRFGRKPLILIGLIIFILGSLLAGIADSIYLLIIGRALQGAGAVGSTILAMLADFTREQHRTKAMAIAGITIGLSFMLAMVIGPMLASQLDVSSMFYVAALMGCVTIGVLYGVVPCADKANSELQHPHPPFGHPLPSLRSGRGKFVDLFISPELLKLNLGIFILHAIFTASFIVIPIGLSSIAGLPAAMQWHLYLPALLIAAVISLFCVGRAERKQQIKPYFIAGVVLLMLAELILWQSTINLTFSAAGLCCFLTSFSLLEAFLPSLVSRTAPAAHKGSAMGIYSSAQFLGIFAGGALGGWLFGQFSFSGVYLFCIFLTLLWLTIAFKMQPPRYLASHLKEQLQSE